MVKHSIVAITLQDLHSPLLPFAVVAKIAEHALRRERAHSVNSRRIQAEIINKPDRLKGPERG